MKHLLIILCLFCFTFQSNAQPTLKNSNYPVPAGYLDVDYVKSGLIEEPQGGANQVWDYSDISAGNRRETQYHDATNDQDFNNAHIYWRRNSAFQDFSFPYDAYEQVDETGHYQVGVRIIDTSYPITAITGGANDVLRFPPTIRLQEGQNFYLKFPMTYQSKWESNFVNYTDFELTVEAFGLNQVPGYNKSIITGTREVVGYGDIIIPMEDGTPSPPIEVLLIKSFTTAVDSFFLGGQPAPPALLAAFGLTQGSVSNSEEEPYYSFYSPDFDNAVMALDFQDEFYLYRPSAAHPKGELKITKANFPRRASNVDRYHRTPPIEFTAPTEGLNQVWDYSNLETEVILENTYMDATNNPLFPDAFLSDLDDLDFQNFNIISTFYEAIDEDGWYETGRTVESITYPITAITGGPSDQLHFPDDVVDYEGRTDNLQFPVTYGKKWTQTRAERTNFEITVAGAGLNAVPGQAKLTYTDTRTVVGEGTIIIPSDDGTGTVSTEVLLIKSEETIVDSFFLAGSPMPPTLLEAFGITQGNVTNRTFYIYYKPNFGEPVLSYNPLGSRAFFRPSALENPCGDGIQNGDETGIDCGGSGCAPCGDLCINATDLQLGTTVTGNTNLFTNNDLTDVCEEVDAPDIGVWYTFVGTGNDVTLSTDYSGTNFDTNLQVFAGECGDLVCVAADEDSGDNFVNSYTSYLSFNTVAGTTYYVYLSGFYGEAGNYELSLSANALPINISHNRVCDVPTEGQSQVTVTITGGTAPYQVSGNFNGEIEENEPFIFILDDNQTSYNIIVVDANGEEAQVFETDLLPCTKLPVELLAFEGEVQSKGNLLQWTTASELNNHFFTLEYSMDGQNFNFLQKITGNGTTSTPNRYEFLHRNAPKGTTYYQLSQTDLDGTTKNLGVISLQRSETTAISNIEVYPTATSHQLNVSYDFVNDFNVATLKVYDMTGRMVKRQNLEGNAVSLQLDVHNLTTGTYILKIENGLEVLNTKFVKF